MRRLSFRVQAEAEIEAAIGWYRSQNPISAENFATAMDGIVGLIQENPFHYQAIEGNIRRVFMQAFPYCIVYLVTPAEVAVIACVHTSRDPNSWRERRR